MNGRGTLARIRDLRACLLGRYSRRSYAQEGEDMILRRFFDGRREGFYVDIGAHHPIRFSNTYFFYRLGWRGINVEPNPDMAAGFRLFRSRDIHVISGVGEKPGEMQYWCFDEPALNTFDEQLMRERISRTRYHVIESRRVPVDRLENLLARYLPAQQQIDFMSIDVEGHDLQVLQSGDWERFRPSIVLVEALEWTLQNAMNHPVDVFMRGIGYTMVAKTHNTLFYRTIR